jgi:hypothetical protein
MTDADKFLGVGLDMGTMNIVSARRTEQGVVTNRIRDSFITVPKEHKKMLRLGNVHFKEMGDDIVIVGDAAYDMANVFGKEVRRPLSAGLIASGEMDAMTVLGFLVQQVLKDPKVPNEVCYFSVPAAPVDDPTKDVIYHRGVLERIITECGYKAVPANEAMAIIYSECAKENFSGISFSFGSGMTNVALSIFTQEGLSFSVARGGDWIDQGAARSTGSTQARMCTIKEKGLNLMKPEGREQEALTVYYKNLIEYAIDAVSREFDKVRNKFDLPNAIPIIVSGGTSKAEGFLEFFKQVFEDRRKRFPIEISEIRAARDPLNAVAQGLLVQAVQEYEDDED